MTTNISVEKTIWDIAIEESEKAEKGNVDSAPMDTNILICGSPESGKTSTLLRFLERDETPKSTVALDYTFARRARASNTVKDVCHIWELGGGIRMTNLLEIALSAKNISNISVVLVLDLSKPNILWETQEILIKEIRSTVDQAMKEFNKENPTVAGRMKEKNWKRIGENHEDKAMMDPLPIPFVIIGGKYDVYQELEPEKKKMICKALRFLAHKNGATLQFSSNKIDTLGSKTRLILGSLAFHTHLSKSSSTDHNKPIFVNAGQDKFDDIGAPQISADRLVRMKSGTPYDLWKEAFAEFFPPEKIEKFGLTVDPTTDKQYAEPLIDEMRAQKEEELVKYRKQRKMKEVTRSSTEESMTKASSRVKKKI